MKFVLKDGSNSTQSMTSRSMQSMNAGSMASMSSNNSSPNNSSAVITIPSSHQTNDLNT
ncbi:MAG: hypothetical protein WCF03_15010 [Nitrososphaeraceae archaeon]